MENEVRMAMSATVGELCPSPCVRLPSMTGEQLKMFSDDIEKIRNHGA